MERLTERNPLWIDDELWERACEPDCEEIDAVYRKLKDYEDAEEQGLLLRLPCKVGDIVYCLIAQGTHGTVYTTGAAISRAVTKIIWDGRRFEIYSERSHIWSNDYNECNYYGYWGETVFLTREAAEARLKELEGK